MPILFHTARLLVREVAPGDALALHALHGDPAVARWMGDGQPLSLPLCEAWIQVSLGNYQRRGYGHCLVEARDGSGIVGGCGIIHGPRAGGLFGPPELIYAILPEHWGRGYASEAAAAMLAWGAGERGLTEVLATIDPDNGPSAAVLRKLGMVWLHTRPDVDGEPVATWRWRAHAASDRLEPEPGTA